MNLRSLWVGLDQHSRSGRIMDQRERALGCIGLDPTAIPPVWDPGEGKNRPTLLSWPDVVRAD